MWPMILLMSRLLGSYSRSASRRPEMLKSVLSSECLSCDEAVSSAKVTSLKSCCEHMLVSD